MPKYTTKLNQRHDVAESAIAFFLEKPTGLQFKAGQIMRVSLIDPLETDAVGLSRLVSSLGFQYLDLFRHANQYDATVFGVDRMLAMRRRVQVVACMQILFSE